MIINSKSLVLNIQKKDFLMNIYQMRDFNL